MDYKVTAEPFKIPKSLVEEQVEYMTSDDNGVSFAHRNGDGTYCIAGFYLKIMEVLD